MADPEAIFTVYQCVYEQAEALREAQLAAGEQVSGTLQLLIAGDRAKILARWCEEMQELVGVLNGVHNDPYIVESTQVFYWASLFAVLSGSSWEDLDFDSLRDLAAGQITLQDPNLIISQAERLAELPLEQVKPQKLFLLWWAADNCYRSLQRFDAHPRRSLAEIMRYDLEDMKKRPYLRAILRDLGLVETS